ncbi:hypothetical protein HDU77_009498 [Chytriomyces hyalinus]|nr:hypothetical protein HDU77_009498 [Chytriomyces hyalinus]
MVTTFCVIGCGLGGLNAVIQTRRQFPNARIVLYEESDGAGGVWRWNRYPGCACDVPSHLYSLADEPNPEWDEHYADSPSIRAYLERVAEKHNVKDIARFNTRVTRLEWNDPTNQWKVTSTSKTTSETTEEWYDYVISANGPLHVPKYPSIHGLGDFTGPVVHTARWRDDVEFRGKRVAVIGTGASAVQAVPELTKVAKSMVVFQRHASWIMPKDEYKYSATVKWIFRNIPLAQRLWRIFIFLTMDFRYFVFVRKSWFSQRLEASVMKLVHTFIQENVQDLVKRKLATPNYPLGARRITPSNSYLKAIDDPKTTLISGDAISHIAPNNIIVTESGLKIPVDVIVLATGFELQDIFQNFKIVGRSSSSDTADNQVPLKKTPELAPELEHVFNMPHPRAYMSACVPQFPNLFLIMGPNSALGHSSVLIPMELQTKYILNLIHDSRNAGRTRVEATPAAMKRWNEFLKEGFVDTVWQADKSSWYFDGKGHNFTLWPFSLSYMMWVFKKRPDLRDFVQC